MIEQVSTEEGQRSDLSLDRAEDLRGGQGLNSSFASGSLTKRLGQMELEVEGNHHEVAHPLQQRRGEEKCLSCTVHARSPWEVRWSSV